MLTSIWNTASIIDDGLRCQQVGFCPASFGFVCAVDNVVAPRLRAAEYKGCHLWLMRQHCSSASVFLLSLTGEAHLKARWSVESKMLQQFEWWQKEFIHRIFDSNYFGTNPCQVPPTHLTFTHTDPFCDVFDLWQKSSDNQAPPESSLPKGPWAPFEFESFVCCTPFSIANASERFERSCFCTSIALVCNLRGQDSHKIEAHVVDQWGIWTMLCQKCFCKAGRDVHRSLQGSRTCGYLWTLGMGIMTPEVKESISNMFFHWWPAGRRTLVSFSSETRMWICRRHGWRWPGFSFSSQSSVQDLLHLITKASSGRAKLEFLFTKIGVGWKLIWPRDRIDISKERALHPPPPPPLPPRKDWFNQ